MRRFRRIQTGQFHQQSFQLFHHSFLTIINRIATAAMAMPISHSQYFSRKPCSATGWMGVSTMTGGVGACTGAAAATGAGAGSATGAGSTTLGAATLALAFFLAFLTTGLGATSSVLATGAGAGSATASGAGAGSTAVVCSTATGAGAASTTASSCGLVAQADNVNTAKSSAVGKANLFILDIVFSSETVDGRQTGLILP